MTWGADPVRTHGPYNLKIVLHVTHPTATTDEVRTFLDTVLLEAGTNRILSKLRADFNQPWIGTKTQVQELQDGGWQLYPKIYVKGDLKGGNRDEPQIVQDMYDDGRALLIAVCENAGYTVTEVNNKRWVRG
jgi:hypothetical protein